jgi:purine-nucleoside phosphorylase
MEVLGISCITNMATGIQNRKHSHEAVVKQAKEAGIRFVKIIKGVIQKLGA